MSKIADGFDREPQLELLAAWEALVPAVLREHCRFESFAFGYGNFVVDSTDRLHELRKLLDAGLFDQLKIACPTLDLQGIELRPSAEAFREPLSIEDVAHAVFAEIESRGQGGLETGFFELDELLNGLHPSELIVIGGRPAMGKTSLALSIVNHVSCTNRIPSVIFSLESTKKQVFSRLLCGRAEIDAHKLRKGLLQSKEYEHLAHVVGEISTAPIWLDDTPALTVGMLHAQVREQKDSHGVRLAVVDYIQLLNRKGRENLHQELADITRALKHCAREIDIPIIATSQLNRWSGENYYRRPRLSDLRDSGSLEDDADVVMLVHREDYYRENEAEFTPDGLAEVSVAKQRNGPTRTVKLQFIGKSMHFANLLGMQDPLA